MKRFRIAKLAQALLVFSLLAAGQPAAALSAQIAPQPAGQRSPVTSAPPVRRSHGLRLPTRRRTRHPQRRKRAARVDNLSKLIRVMQPHVSYE